MPRVEWDSLQCSIFLRSKCSEEKEASFHYNKIGMAIIADV